MNVYLIGYRGVGKSTVAPLLAERLGRPWIDLDREIETAARLSIPEIFSRLGERAFRDMESAQLASAAAKPGAVVATGGGIVLREENRSLLRQGVCVWLRAPVETILSRVAGTTSRPALTTLPLKEETERLLELRSPFYDALADVSLDVHPWTTYEVAEQITAAIGRLEKGLGEDRREGHAPDPPPGHGAQ